MIFLLGFVAGFVSMNVVVNAHRAWELNKARELGTLWARLK